MKQIIFKVEESLLHEYKLYCLNNKISMSDDLRNYVINKIKIKS